MRLASRLVAALVLLIFSARLAFAQTVNIQFNPSQSQVLWTLPDVLHTVHGTFQLSSGAIVFNTRTGSASGLFVVDEATGQSGDGVRDGRMKKSILKIAEYPTATFKPEHVTGGLSPSGNSTVAVDGIWHLYGEDRPLQLKFNINTTGNSITASTTFDIPYVAWGMHDPSTLFLRVGKSVRMDIAAKGTLVPPK